MLTILILMAAVVAISRKYVVADIDMLNACSSILGCMRERKEAFLDKRPKYDDAFLASYDAMLDQAYAIVGTSNVSQLKAATREVMRLRDEYLSDLGDFKTFLGTDFAEDPERYEEILYELGFPDYYKHARRAQAALIQFLSAFKVGMTPGLRAEIEAAGMNPLLIERLTLAGRALFEANTAQEVLKAGRPERTQTDIVFLNRVYLIAKGLAVDGQRIFKDDPALRAMFAFRAHLATAKRTRVAEAGILEDDMDLADTDDLLLEGEDTPEDDD